MKQEEIEANKPYKYNMEKEEYNRDTNPYPSFGKKYNGEKAIISMTSWKMRIATCSKTIYSLLKQCPGFHIVLVLSEEEFPKMMDELPETLKLFADNELIEVLWVYKNYKSFKKVLFTMDKYRDVPIISADDDCIYTCNYAQMLYDEWNKTQNPVIATAKNISLNVHLPTGPSSLYKLNDNVITEIKKVLNMDLIINANNDDFTFGYIFNKMHITLSYKYMKYPTFHDEICGGNHQKDRIVKKLLDENFKL